MLEVLRRVLGYRASVATLIETALWVALLDVVVGVGWAFSHPGGAERIQTQLERQLHLPPSSAYELAAVAEVTVLWPVVLLLPSDACQP